jgi:hypothetical protein
MMMEFREWFCLRNRANFTIDPKVNPTDARFYFGRDDIKDKVLKQMRHSFAAPGTPKMMIWGPYGSGKTQTLFYLDWTLHHDPPQTISTKELETLGVTRNLGQVGAGGMVVALIAIGKLAERNGAKLIFLLDEMEELQNVRTGDATESIHQYFRRLSDSANSTVGFMVGFKANTLSEGPRILTREDIGTRIGTHNYIEVGHLPAVSDVKRFMEELLEHLVDADKANDKIQTEALEVTVKTYPFAPSAFELLADYASQDPYKALPRNIINAINECAIQAWDEEKALVDDEIVNDVAPLVFA